MALNLHGEVRAAIGSVNPDTLATYLKSTGFTVDSTGKQVPGYASPTTPFGVQVQAASAEDLQHTQYANQEGVYRSVFMFGNTQGVVRVDAKGGDLLKFPQFFGGSDQTWLVIAVKESWGNVGGGGWSNVIVALQTDA